MHDYYEQQQGEKEASSSSSRPRYANRHIPSLLALPRQQQEAAGSFSSGSLVQVVDNGSLLTADSFRNETFSLHRPVLVTDTPESIGMKLPSSRSHRNGKPQQGSGHRRGRLVSVRDIADMVGHNTPVHAIDVEFQEELDGWSFADLVDYFEDEDRIRACSGRQEEESASSSAAAATTRRSSRPQRQAAQRWNEKASERHYRVINQISYEFSATPLAKHVRSPAFVRELDWIDTVWPKKKNKTKKDIEDGNSEYPAVQYYCLTSAAGCYTDFHVDFGGTSVWYHVLSGCKDFILIVPTAENLQIYEDWLCSKDQACTFLPNLIPNHSKNVVRVELRQHQTMIIPAGWIHAVYTPADSLVFGGNWLHGLDIEMQLQIYSIEVRSKVLERFRFPFFLQLQYYAAGVYLTRLRQGRGTTVVCPKEVQGLGHLITALTGWWYMHSKQDEPRGQDGGAVTIAEAAAYAARQNGCTTFEELLEALTLEHQRVLGHDISKNSSSAAAPTICAPKAPAPALSSSSSPPSSAPGRRKIRLKLGLSAKLNHEDDSSNSRVKEGKKIRLTIGSAARQQKQKQPPQEGDIKNNNSGGSPSFRIKVSAASRKGDPLPGDVPVVRSRPREDMAALFDERDLIKDEEWVPPASLLQVTTDAAATDESDPTNTKKRSSSSGRAVVAKKIKKPSARQRLLKKVR